jgi:hypothetical protein
MSSRKDAFLQRIELLMDRKLVDIDQGAIDSARIVDLPDIAASEPPPPPIQSALDIIRFALLVNSINHQFWDVADGQFERYSHQGKVGAIAMMAGVGALLSEAGSFDALEKRGPLLPADIARCFGPIPDPAGRAQALNESIGPKGKAAAMLLADAWRDEGHWDLSHASAVSTLLPAGFEDSFLKKSQLCLWMAQGMMASRGFEPPSVELTCFADYQIPKVLRGMGVLLYGKRIAAKVDAGCVMEQDSPEEIAIRAATVIACEKLSAALGISAPQLDFWLWTQRNEHSAPFHRVRTRRY